MKYSRRLRQVTDTSCCLILFAFATAAVAQPTADRNALDQFAADVQVLDARFVQELLDADGFVIESETATGRFQMRRPDEFRWHQEPPFEQVVVADGELVWMYDVDLEQVSCAPFSDFADAPALILGGEGQIDDNYAVRELPPTGTGRRVELTPIDGLSSEFIAATVTLENSVPVMLEILDGLEQVTRIRFSAIEVNPPLAADAFSFVVPDDVHVVCDFD